MRAPPRHEVAEVLRLSERSIRTAALSPDQGRVVRRLLACRTAALGGHVDECDTCGHRVVSYNSCRDRHCPKCQASATADWLERQSTTLLPVPYTHVVFTLPHMLAPLALQNPRLLYGLLFRAAAETLLEVAADPRHLGARIGFLAILHTWGQTLLHHPHIHCLVPAGGLALDHSRWIPCRRGFFLPVRVLSRVFRGKWLALAREAYDKGLLDFHGTLDHLNDDPVAFARLLSRSRRHDWNVYAKPPFGGPEQALKYLARYTHRIAISNHRLLAVDARSVTLSWKDYAHGNRQRTLHLDTNEFIRRFLLHVLPSHFVRIRSYGLLANCTRSAALETCRTLLVRRAPDQSTSSESRSADADRAHAVAGEPASVFCPRCSSGILHRLTLQPYDTS
jgi:hypothetical protein